MSRDRQAKGYDKPGNKLIKRGFQVHRVGKRTSETGAVVAAVGAGSHLAYHGGSLPGLPKAQFRGLGPNKIVKDAAGREFLKSRKVLSWMNKNSRAAKLGYVGAGISLVGSGVMWGGNKMIKTGFKNRGSKIKRQADWNAKQMKKQVHDKAIRVARGAAIGLESGVKATELGMFPGITRTRGWSSGWPGRTPYKRGSEEAKRVARGIRYIKRKDLARYKEKRKLIAEGMRTKKYYPYGFENQGVDLIELAFSDTHVTEFRRGQLSGLDRAQGGESKQNVSRRLAGRKLYSKQKRSLGRSPSVETAQKVKSYQERRKAGYRKTEAYKKNRALDAKAAEKAGKGSAPPKQPAGRSSAPPKPPNRAVEARKATDQKLRKKVKGKKFLSKGLRKGLKGGALVGAGLLVGEALGGDDY